MKNRVILMLLFSVAFISCKKSETTQFEEPPKVEAIPAIVDECYLFIKGKDTIAAYLIIEEGKKVSGKLAYEFFEKDKSAGSISGTLKGDTLIADYTFQSEGTTSVRQVAFLRKANSLTEGYGDSEEKEGKMVFKDSEKLNFDGKMVMEKIPCE